MSKDNRFINCVAFGSRYNISLTMSGNREPQITIQDMEQDFKVIHVLTLEELVQKLPIEEEKKEEGNATG